MTTTSNRIRAMVVVESELATIYQSPTKLMQYIRLVGDNGDNEVTLVFTRVNTARVLRRWADEVEGLER